MAIASNHNILLEGSSSNRACIIDSGLVGVYREDSRGNRSPVHKPGKNGLFGEMGLIDKYPRSAMAIALQDTRCAIIEKSRFDHLTKFNPRFMVGLIRSLTEKLRTAITRLNKIGSFRQNQSAR